jgi:hypothetical protein
MPFKDRNRSRDYHRDYARTRRLPATVCQTPAQTRLPSEFRLKTARDVLNLIDEQVAAVRADADAGTLEKARTIGYLAGIALRAVETAELAERVEAVERALKQRKESDACPSCDWPTFATPT